jgi:uncharacterized protein DUF4124
MNARRRPVLNFAWSLCVAGFLCAATGASAQAIFRQVDAEGRITYTDRPDTTPLIQTAADPALEVANALASNSAISSRRAAMVDANEAARRLRQTEFERRQGVERLPGEQARGISADAANERYRRRQEELLRMVEQAQLRLSEVHWSLRNQP